MGLATVVCQIASPGALRPTQGGLRQRRFRSRPRPCGRSMSRRLRRARCPDFPPNSDELRRSPATGDPGVEVWPFGPDRGCGAVPGYMIVSGGRVRRRLRIELMMVAKSDSGHPVSAGPPGTRVSPVKAWPSTTIVRPPGVWPGVCSSRAWWERNGAAPGVGDLRQSEDVVPVGLGRRWSSRGPHDGCDGHRRRSSSACWASTTRSQGPTVGEQAGPPCPKGSLLSVTPSSYRVAFLRTHCYTVCVGTHPEEGA